MRLHARWLATLGGLAVAGALSAPLGLRAAGALLVVHDPVERADAIFVFPGEMPRRAECAERLYRTGVAPRIVLSGARIAPALMVVGMPFSDAALNALALRDMGVPGDAIVRLDEGTSTWEDARALHDWAREAGGVRRLVAVTSPAHSRRARWTLRRVFRDENVDVLVHACPSVMSPGWWRREETFLRVTNEYLKLAYYAIAH